MLTRIKNRKFKYTNVSFPFLPNGDVTRES